MVLFDLIIALVVIFMAYLGYKEGILSQLGKLGALIIALLVINIFNGKLGGLVQSVFSSLNEVQAHYLGDVILFGVVFVTINSFSDGLSEIFEKIHLGWANSILGAIFSVFKTLILFSIILWIILLFDDVNSAKFIDSKAFVFLMKLIPNLFDLI